MNPSPTPAPADSVGWIAPTELGRAEQLRDTHPHLIAERLELRWFPNADLLTHATEQVGKLGAKSDVVVLRPAQTRAQQNAVDKMSKPLSELRGLMEKKFKDDYQSYYPQFGLVKSNKNWILPTDYDDLLIALETKLLPSLLKYGFDQDPDTGTAVWESLLQQLDTAHDAAREIDTNRAGLVGQTQPQDEKTTLALRCAVHLVQAHFPGTWENVLRAWGWRKTSF